MRRSLAALLAALMLLSLTGQVFAQEETDIGAILAGMTVEEKAAQMFLTRCPSSGAKATVKKYQPGGYVLFAADFEDQTVDSIQKVIAGYQENAKIPMLIAADEEGGTVTRVSRFKAFRDQKFKSPRALYLEGGLSRIVEDSREKSRLLLSLGVNLNLAPVADVSQSEDDYMYSRALGESAEATSVYVASVVAAMNEEGIGCALKHFPGYGTNKDTHEGIAYDERSYQSFVDSDFLPFQAGIDAGAGCVMVSHNIVKSMDEKYPASLSRPVHRVLRETLGFEGVIVTDDLYMQAIKQYTDAGAAAVLAIEAGNDLLCCTDFTTQLKAVLKAVKSGRITEERLNESVTRILKWKASLGLLS